jgi:aldose 1-epimerase
MGAAEAGHSVQRGTLDGYATYTLTSDAGDLHATFAPSCGMIGCSLVHAGEELVGGHGGLAEYAREGVTMGIPFLHPWANRLAGWSYTVEGRTVSLDRDSPLIHLDENGLPIHGLLAASSRWEVRDTGADGKSATLSAELDFAAHEELLKAFPFPHVVRMDVRLEGSALTITTTVEATGDATVPIAFGYHPYLQLPGAPREQWEVALPVRTRLILDDRMIPTGASEPISHDRGPLGERAFDDAFDELVPPHSFAAAAAGREVGVTFLEGYPFGQVYAPPGEQFICFEPMTAPTNALASGAGLRTVPPGDSFSAAFSISVT